MLFSIITVCFNSEKTIRRTFDAMLEQSCQDFEYLVIDGNSTDHTVDIIREYEPRFNGKMLWTSEPDNGLYDAMNKGIRRAKGQIIGIINSDDHYHKDALLHIKEAYTEHPGKDVYYGIQANLNEQGKIINLERYSEDCLKFRMTEHSSVFLSLEAYKKYGLYKGDLYPLGADYDLLLRIYLGQGSFFPVDYIISYFALGGKSSNVLRAINDHLQSKIANGLVSRPGAMIRYIWNFFHVMQIQIYEKYKRLGMKENPKSLH